MQVLFSLWTFKKERMILFLHNENAAKFAAKSCIVTERSQFKYL